MFGLKKDLPGGDSAVVPPDPMPNSEVKRRSADGSVGLPHVRVGNCQVLIKRRGCPKGQPFLLCEKYRLLFQALYFVILGPICCNPRCNLGTSDGKNK